MWLKMWLLVALLAFVGTTSSESVQFPRLTVSVVDETKLLAAERENHANVKKTGAKLFDASKLKGDARLGSSAFVKHIKSPGTSKYFRAHVLVVNCIDAIFSRLDKPGVGHALKVLSGFKTKKEVSGNNDHDLYARSGTAVAIGYRPDSKTKDLKDIAEAAVQLCPQIFATIQRDIGMTLLSDSVVIYMRGPEDGQPLFVSMTGSPTSAQFKQQSEAQITAGFQLKGPNPASCENIVLASGQMYPTGATSPESIVGSLDEPVIRGNNKDFLRLIQFPGGMVRFKGEESASSWCGISSIQCHPCSESIFGSSVENRCADRMMSPRMYNAMMKLQYMIKKKLGNVRLEVSEAWDEPHEKKTTGDNPAGSLHYEGRQIELKFVGGDTSKFNELTELAICAGMDYVKNNGQSITCAVKKQATVNEKNAFWTYDGQVDLYFVEPPTSKKATYAIDEKLDLPLFDGGNRDAVSMGSATIGIFKSPKDVADKAHMDKLCLEMPDGKPRVTHRYFRLDPVIVACHNAIKDRLKNDLNKDLVLTCGYVAPEEWEKVDPFVDDRGMGSTYGDAMHLTYDGFDGHTLAKMAMDECATVVHDSDQEMGVGFYQNAIYLDLRDAMDVWLDDPARLPDGVKDVNELADQLEERFEQNYLGHRFAPHDEDEACKNDDPPLPQSPTYKNKQSAATQTSGKGACVPQTGTTFCTKSLAQRKEEFKTVWREISRKHSHRDAADIKNALEQCLVKLCGTCMEGQLWEDKLEHCSNLIHWIPFETLNDRGDTVSFFYPSSNEAAWIIGCRKNGHHCVNNSPLNALFHPSVKSRRYRPDPKVDVEEKVYDSTHNPSPLPQLIQEMYASYAKGKVTVLVDEEEDIVAMKSVLKVLMSYSKNVTSIVFKCSSEDTVDAVSELVEGYIADWVQSLCPKNTREYTTPYTIESSWPQAKTKRDIEEGTHDFATDLRRKDLNWEINWIENQFSP